MKCEHCISEMIWFHQKAAAKKKKKRTSDYSRLVKMDAFLKIYKIKTIYDLLAQVSALQLWTAKHCLVCPACSHRAKAGDLTQCTQISTIKWLKSINFPLSPLGSFSKNTVFKTCLNNGCDATTSADGIILILHVFLN